MGKQLNVFSITILILTNLISIWYRFSSKWLRLVSSSKSGWKFSKITLWFVRVDFTYFISSIYANSKLVFIVIWHPNIIFNISKSYFTNPCNRGVAQNKFESWKTNIGFKPYLWMHSLIFMELHYWFTKMLRYDSQCLLAIRMWMINASNINLWIVV